MKWLILILLILVGAVGVTLLVLEDPGYVLISYDVWTVETSLSFFVVAWLVGYAVLHYLGQLAGGLWHLPARVHQWQRHRHSARALAAFNRGMTALMEGRWRTAERELLRHVRYAEAPMLNYLGAARAAQRLGEPERRDRYLHQAYQSAPSAELAVGLTQAELQIAHQQLEQALATLAHLHSVEPRNRYVLRLLARVYGALQDWHHLRELLPELRRRQALDDSALQELERRVHGHLLDEAAAAQDLERLRTCWNDLPRHLREDEQLVHTYAEALHQQGADAAAEALVRGALRHRWSEPLVHLYGMLQSDEPARQLSVAEAWLKEHGKNPVLLLTLGRLCLRNRLWGKARIYFESSLAVNPRPEAYRELAHLLEQMGDSDSALQYYRQGMALMVAHSEAASLPANVAEQSLPDDGEPADTEPSSEALGR